MNFTLAIATLWMSGPAQAASPCLPVRGDKVLASEIAARLPTFSSLEPGTPLFPAPAAGIRRLMSPADVRILAARFGIDAVNSTAPAGFCIVGQARTLESAEVAAAIQRALPAEYGIEVVDFSRYSVPLGQVAFEKNGIAAAGTPHTRAVLWRGVVRTGEGRTAPIWARVRLTRIETALVAKRDLPRGSVVEPADLTLVERRTSAMGGGKPVSIDAVANRMTRRTIRAGETLTADLTEPVPEVRAGQQVRVQVREGTVRLGVSVQAERSARAGELIWLRAEAGGRRFAARVTGPGQAEVEPHAPIPHDRRKIEKTDIHAGADRIDQPSAVAER